MNVDSRFTLEENTVKHQSTDGPYGSRSGETDTLSLCEPEALEHGRHRNIVPPDEGGS